MKIEWIEEKCNHCMRCVEDCASGVWRNVNGTPVVSDPELCNRCSHCLSVCPKKAILNTYLKEEDITRVTRKFVDPKAYKEIVLSRRSVRRYKNKPVDRKILNEIIHLARHSPTASNSQHVSYIIIDNEKIMKEISEKIFSIARRLYDLSVSGAGKYIFKGLKLSRSIDLMLQKYIEPMEYYIGLKESGRDLILHNAPALILLHAPAKSFFASDNCSIAATNISNYAHSMGLGSCMIGFLTLAARFNKNLCRLIKLPKGRTLYASIVIGHPSYKHPYTASRKNPDIQWINE